MRGRQNGKRERTDQMSTVNPVASTSTNQTTNQTSSAIADSTKEMGKTEFLKLLVTQLKNQDPMNPMDNQQFIAQLATFSSLEQLISINKGITTLAEDAQKTATTPFGDSSDTTN
jgi:flagellar basal-body rod modification protein FlgD